MRKICGILLALTMMFSCIPLLPSFATDGVLTLNDILGEDVTVAREYVFDENFDFEGEGVDESTFPIDAQKGATLTNENWLILNEDFLSGNRAFEMQLEVNGDPYYAKAQIYMYVQQTDGTRLGFYVADGCFRMEEQNGALCSVRTSMARGDGNIGAVKGTYTLLFKDEGTCYQVYYKNADGDWAELFKTATKKTSTSAPYFKIVDKIEYVKNGSTWTDTPRASNAPSYLKYVKIWEKPKKNEPFVPAEIPNEDDLTEVGTLGTYEVDFSSADSVAETGGATIDENMTVAKSELTLTATTTDTVYKPTNLAYFLGEQGVMKISFRLDDKNSDIDLTLGTTFNNTKVNIFTEGGKLGYYGYGGEWDARAAAEQISNAKCINPGEALEVGKYYTLLVKMNNDNVEYHLVNDDKTAYEKVAEFKLFTEDLTVEGSATGVNTFHVSAKTAEDSETATSVSIAELKQWIGNGTVEDMLGTDKLATQTYLKFDDNFSITDLGYEAGVRTIKPKTDGDGTHGFVIEKDKGFTYWSGTGFAAASDVKAIETRIYPNATKDNLTVQVMLTEDATDKGRMYVNFKNGTISVFSGNGWADASQNSNYGSIYIPNQKTGAEWVDLMFTNQGGGGALYVKNEDGEWAQIFKLWSNWSNKTKGGITITKADSNADGAVDPTYIEYIKVYTSENVFDDEEITPANNTFTVLDMDFETVDELAAENVTVNENASIEDGKLKAELPAFGQILKVENAYIPVGGYAEWKYRTSNNVAVAGFYNGNTQMEIQPYAPSGKATYSDGDASSATKMSYVSAGIGHESDIYYTYRIVHNNDGTYSAYRKTDDDVYWIRVFENVTPKTVSDSRCFFFNGVAGMTYLDYVKIFSPTDPTVVPDPDPDPKPDPDPDPEPDEGHLPVETDVNVLSRSTAVLLRDSFEDDVNWDTSTQGEGSVIIDGTAKLATVNISDDARISLKEEMKESWTPGEKWYMTYKTKKSNRGVWTFVNYCQGVGASYYATWSNGTITHRSNPNVTFNVNETVDEWYEWLVEGNGTESLNVFCRPVDSDEWTTVFENIPCDKGTVRGLTFSAGVWSRTAGTYEIDDIMVYNGMLLDLESSLEGNVLSINGDIYAGTPKDTKERQVTLFAVVYDKEYGYTKSVQSANFNPYNTELMDVEHRFTLEGFDPEKSDYALLIWDSAETGVPLELPRGYALTNSVDLELFPETGAERSIEYDVRYNEVQMKGFVGENAMFTASLIDAQGNVKAIGQTQATKAGMVDTVLKINPACSSGEYTLRVQYGNCEHVDNAVEMFCADILDETQLTDENAMCSFINSYGNDNDKLWNSQEGFAKDVYERYVEAGGVAIVEAEEFYKFKELLNKAIEDEVNEREMLKALNTSIGNKKWNETYNLVVDTYSDILGIVKKDLSGIKNIKGVFAKMEGGYTSTEEVCADFEAALDAQREEEKSDKNPGSSGGGSGFGGGTGGALSVPNVGAQNQIQPIPPTVGDGNGSVIEFNDLESVPWAKNAIIALCREGMVNGVGNNSFSPNRTITREEFLKIVLQAVGIEGSSNINTGFDDVDSSAWYAKYVASAVEKGIVKGVSTTRFGVGESITRADMAVMLMRAMRCVDVEVKAVKPAFVFDDFPDIPDYAADDISALCRAGFMNGVGNNTFAPKASATRAEASTAVYRIFEYIKGGE